MYDDINNVSSTNPGINNSQKVMSSTLTSNRSSKGNQNLNSNQGSQTRLQRNVSQPKRNGTPTRNKDGKKTIDKKLNKALATSVSTKLLQGVA